MIVDSDLLTISGLAAAFKRDRRTVAALLANASPATVTVERGRTIRRFRRGDVGSILTAPTAADTLKQAFERLHRAQADLREAKRALRNGELLLLADFERELVNRFMKTRTALLGFCNKHGGQIQSLQQIADRTAARVQLVALLDRAGTEIVADVCAPFSWDER